MRFVQNDRNGLLYIAATMLWSWGVLLVPALLGLDFESPVTKTAYILAGGSPSVIALIFVIFSGDRAYRTSFFKRIVRFGTVNIKGLVMLFLYIPGVTAAGAMIGFKAASEVPAWPILAYLKDPAGLVAFAAFTFLFGPLAEEIGWRGYLLDRLKDKGPLFYGGGIGLIWTFWHFPMFLIEGTYQNGLLGRGLPPVLNFGLSTVALGIVIGELAKERDSILSAILFHFMINFCGETMPLGTFGGSVQTGLFILSGLFVLYLKLKKTDEVKICC